MTIVKSALTILCASMIALLQPPIRQPVSVWAAENVVVPDGPQAGQLMDFELTPYLREPMDMTSFEYPENEIAIRKSAQTGFTLFLLASAAHMIVNEPCNAMIVQPTQGAMSAFHREKLMRVINETGVLKSKIKDQVSRSSDSSTADSKQYPGGSLALAIASSSKDLRSKTIKWSGNDEIDEYSMDLDGQGPSLDMIKARQTSFLMSGEWKRIKISTPIIKGQSQIDDAFNAGDQRYWHMPCPNCSEEFKYEFDFSNFRFDDTYPHNAYYVTSCCGHPVAGHEKVELMKRGRWIATATRPGAYPSYHFDALTSPFVPWDEIAAEFVAAKDNPAKMKSFTNLVLGLAYEMTGDAPDHERLMERRIPDLRRGVIPPNGVVLVAGADVQGNGIYYNIRAFASDGQNWPVDGDFLAGETNDPRAGAFLELSKVVLREWPDSYGGKLSVDMFAVDAGYRSNVVYTFARQFQASGVVAIQGVEGWFKPAFGVGVPVEINYNNKRIRQGTVRYPVGTWALKGNFYASLRQKGLAGGAEKDPSNYIHFAGWQDESYFKQITGEYLATETYRGRSRRVWKPVVGKENHFLDTEVYLRALFHHMTDRFTAEDWQILLSERNVPVEAINPDMFAAAPHLVSSEKPAPSSNQNQKSAASDSFWDS